MRERELEQQVHTHSEPVAMAADDVHLQRAILDSLALNNNGACSTRPAPPLRTRAAVLVSARRAVAALHCHSRYSREHVWPGRWRR